MHTGDDPKGETAAALGVLKAYAIFAVILAAGRAISGHDATLGLASGGLVFATATWAAKARGGRRVLADWLPFLSLPLLYSAIPQTALPVGPFDHSIQAADRLIFGADIARTLAGRFPSPGLSEVLHAAYLAYYPIIYVPPLVMYWRGDREAFRLTVTGFTWAMVLCFVLFCVGPVAGPRYEWAAPAGVPDGWMRSLAVGLLERGSARGTAFPSSHMAIALVMSLSSYRWSRWLGLTLMAVTMALGVGAVYGGFHYATDMGVGAAVGGLAWLAVQSQARTRSPKPLQDFGV